MMTVASINVSINITVTTTKSTLIISDKTDLWLLIFFNYWFIVQLLLVVYQAEWKLSCDYCQLMHWHGARTCVFYAWHENSIKDILPHTMTRLIDLFIHHSFEWLLYHATSILHSSILPSNIIIVFILLFVILIISRNFYRVV